MDSGRTLALAVIGLNFSPVAYRDEHGMPARVMPAPELATHQFIGRADGSLEHWIDEKLRATVPPEGLADYVLCWPAAGDIVRTLADRGPRIVVSVVEDAQLADRVDAAVEAAQSLPPVQSDAPGL